MKVKYNKPDLLVINKKEKLITIVEIGVTSQDNLQQVEGEKLRKYDVLANELGLIYGFKTKIIPYVITWDGIVTKYHKQYSKQLEIPPSVEAYIRYVTLKKTLESISLDYRRGDKISVEKPKQEINGILARDSSASPKAAMTKT